MPFSLNIAPKVFTKLITVIVSSLRSEGILVAAYLDDWLVWAESKQLCKAHVQRVIAELEARGFIMNGTQPRSSVNPNSYER